MDIQIAFMGWRWAERRLDLLPGFCHPFDPRIARLVQERFELRFGVQFRNWFIRRRTHDVYWTIWHTLRRTCQRHIERECTSSNFTASAETLASPFFLVLCIRYVPIGPRLMLRQVTSHPGSLVC